MASFTIVKRLCACVLPQSQPTSGVVIQLSGTDKDVGPYIDRSGNTMQELIRLFYACSYDVICYLFRSYRTCTVGNYGSIAPNRPTV